MADAIVCVGIVQNANARCLRTTCPQCGFKQLGGRTPLQKQLVGADGHLLPDAVFELQALVPWAMLKSCDSTPNASADGSGSGEKTLGKWRE
eukprot:5975215-Pleurochrysis_carterae.AAC.1